MTWESIGIEWVSNCLAMPEVCDVTLFRLRSLGGKPTERPAHCNACDSLNCRRSGRRCRCSRADVVVVAALPTYCYCFYFWRASVFFLFGSTRHAFSPAGKVFFLLIIYIWQQQSALTCVAAWERWPLLPVYNRVCVCCASYGVCHKQYKIGFYNYILTRNFKLFAQHYYTHRHTHTETRKLVNMSNSVYIT